MRSLLRLFLIHIRRPIYILGSWTKCTASSHDTSDCETDFIYHFHKTESMRKSFSQHPAKKRPKLKTNRSKTPHNR